MVKLPTTSNVIKLRFEHRDMTHIALRIWLHVFRQHILPKLIEREAFARIPHCTVRDYPTRTRLFATNVQERVIDVVDVKPVIPNVFTVKENRKPWQLAVSKEKYIKKEIK